MKTKTRRAPGLRFFKEKLRALEKAEQTHGQTHIAFHMHFTPHIRLHGVQFPADDVKDIWFTKRHHYWQFIDEK